MKKQQRVREKQIDPVLPPTATKAFIAEFYFEGKALGSVKLVLRTDKIGERLGLAFKRAHPECLTANEVRWFER